MNSISPKRYLTLATAWEGHSGGVTVNRDLSIALAELGHDVHARASRPSSRHPLVKVHGLDPVPGMTDERGQLLRADGIPRNVDVIIGHGRFTGGAASYLRGKFYPGAKVVHITHALTDELDRLRGDPAQATQHAETERLLISKADLAVGVGPLLTDDAARLARMCENPPPVQEMIPGVPIGRASAPHPLQQRTNLLLFGRASDPLKGVDTAAEVLAHLRGRGIDAQLTVLGAGADGLHEMGEELRKKHGHLVKLKPFTSDRSVIESEMRGADLMIMASSHDGFGLTATEAAGYGVPVLVPSNIGAGMFFNDGRRIPPELGRPSVIQVPAGSGAAPVSMWADRVESMIKDMPGTRDRSLKLQEHLGKNFTWGHAAQELDQGVDRARVPSKGKARTADVSRSLGARFREGGSGAEAESGQGGKEKYERFLKRTKGQGRGVGVPGPEKE